MHCFVSNDQSIKMAILTILVVLALVVPRDFHASKKVNAGKWTS